MIAKLIAVLDDIRLGFWEGMKSSFMARNPLAQIFGIVGVVMFTGLAAAAVHAWWLGLPLEGYLCRYYDIPFARGTRWADWK